MMAKDKIFKLKGVVQHYAWGGAEFIPGLLAIPNETKQPCAEYWMGAHPSAPSSVLMNQEWVSLKKLIDENADLTISRSVQDKFGELPYLLKVLDVKDMLSIQVHPTKAEAEKGFDAEEAAGIVLNAPNRNYKDRNHKPEVMVALSEFWLLHGFKKASVLADTIEMNIELSVLLPLFKKEGIKALYQFVMEMDQCDVNAVLMPLVKKSIRQKLNGSITKSDPAWWAAKLYEATGIPENIDRGIFSIYFFNIVKVNPGEAVFQKAGVPHAYLEGQNIELMANSDNVLRAGLTPKYIDVAELLKHTLFEEVLPDIMLGKPVQPGEMNYPCPVSDFGIAKIDLSADFNYTGHALSLEILIVTAGGMVVNNELALKRGEAVAMLTGAEYNLTASGTCTIFKAFVPAL